MPTVHEIATAPITTAILFRKVWHYVVTGTPFWVVFDGKTVAHFYHVEIRTDKAQAMANCNECPILKVLREL